MRPFLVTGVALLAITAEARQGLRSLVNGGNGQVTCETDGGCSWDTAYIENLWVNHENIYWQCYKPGLIALTFDDGPSPETTPAVLEKLKDANVQATFFINGVRLTYGDSDEIGAILTTAEKHGHTIAHHTYNHNSVKAKYHELNGQPTEETISFFEEEIAKNTASVAKYLPIRGIRPYFRPPRLEMDSSVATYLKEAYGMHVIQISADTKDYAADTADAVVDALEPSFEKSKDEYSYISLQHDTMQATVDAIDQVIALAKDNNYKLVTIDECLNYPEGRQCTGVPCDTETKCRSKNGFCGTGDTYCNADSTWTKQDCSGPSTCTGEPCSNGKCRSQYGHCGTGDVYCNQLSLWTPDCVACSGDPCPNQGDCRSQYGFCGSEDGHCNALSTWSPSCPSTNPSPTTTPSPTTPSPTTPAPTATDPNTPSPTTANNGPLDGGGNVVRESVECTGDPCPTSDLCRSAHGFCGIGVDYCNTDSTWTSKCPTTASATSLSVTAMAVSLPLVVAAALA